MSTQAARLAAQFVTGGISAVKPLPLDPTRAPNVATAARKGQGLTEGFRTVRPQNPEAVYDTEKARLIGLIQRNQSLTRFQI